MSSPTERLTSALADRYVVEDEIGAGGMATVYRARDLRHEREVAIKVLHPDLGAALGGERFLSEIRTTARLQHAHILPLLDSGAAEGLLYYVMPLVTGETLRHRLEREKQLPLEDAIRIARESASALDYAHRQGVIHRDMKPENILLHEGQALVADFGIALAVQTAGGQRMTQTGLSLGTPQYMSPEQAMGEKTIDARSDVYALGAVTYEMLTGEPPFTGATVQAIVAKVLTERPMNPMAVRDTVPPHVAASVLKALAKLPADRFASAAQFAEALVHPEIMSATVQATTTLVDGKSVDVRRTGLRRHLAAAPAIWLALAVTAATAVFALTRPHAAPTAPSLVVAIEPPSGIEPETATSLALSPDGTSFAFMGADSTRMSRLMVQSLSGQDAIVVSRGTASTPAFSPDGRSVAFFNVETQALEIRSLDGGRLRSLARMPGQRGMTWLGDSAIVLMGGGKLRWVPVDGETVREVKIDAPPGTLVLNPFAINANTVLASVSENGGFPRLVTIAINDGRVTPLGLEGGRPSYADAGVLTFIRDGSLWGVEFDAKTLTVRGAPSLVAAETAEGRVTSYAVSRNGVIMLQRSLDAGGELVIVDRSGTARPVFDGKRTFRWPRFSPSGESIVVGINVRGNGGDIWVVGRRSGTIARITADSLNTSPEWDPDGRQVHFASRTGPAGLGRIVRAPANGGPALPLVSRPNPMYESALTPDRRTLVWREDAPLTGRDILSAPIDSPSVVRPIRQSAADERGFSLSPDGKWLAYTSNETGAPQVYVCRLEPNGPRWPVSRHGGSEPRWARSGELFFRQGDSVFVSRVTLGAEPAFSDPIFLFAGRYIAAPFEPLWDVSPDAQAFVMVRQSDDANRSRRVLMINWIEEWRAKRR